MNEALCKQLTPTGGNMSRLVQFPSYESKFKITTSPSEAGVKFILMMIQGHLLEWNF
jgi:hypothetical protein